MSKSDGQDLVGAGLRVAIHIHGFLVPVRTPSAGAANRCLAPFMHR